MDWLFIAISWYAVLLILGLIFTPLTRRIFGNFFDQGYPFAKTIAILLLTYVTFLLGVLKILPFTQISLFLLIAASAFLMGAFAKKFKEKQNLDLKTLIFEEVLFLISFLFLIYVRGQEPSIRGLEKFMDFGFMNSALRSKFFPPLDMWLSSDPQHPLGYSINYYYFGHLTGAFLMKITGVLPAMGYNLILATIFAQAITSAFSLCANLAHLFQKAAKKINYFLTIFIGVLGSFIINLGGNLHTIYLFTKGYPNDSPIPFWKILSGFNPQKYWYPNATRFIPYTIHEFPSYSYVVADLHGHVFDIPFVLLTLAILLRLTLMKWDVRGRKMDEEVRSETVKNLTSFFKNPTSNFPLLISITAGFMAAVHYMTNAFDGPIYLLVFFIFYFLFFGATTKFLKTLFLTSGFFILFSLPFTLHFNAFVSGIGLNCSPSYLTSIKKLGPFLFEKGNCQVSPLWMLFVLWGFFFINFILFSIIKFWEGKKSKNKKDNPLDVFALVLFSLGFFLILVPEFFYIKDIYPLHFRANTMFKLGYQAFMMMGAASAYVFFRITTLRGYFKYLLKVVFIAFFCLVFLYPFFSFPSYYGNLTKKPNLDGSTWMKTDFPQDKQIVDYLNKNILGQPVVLEAQGDSYTDYERISAYTGMPTVAGWWVHEWLWRGSSDVVGQRIPDIVNIYESSNLSLTKELLAKYGVSYVVVSGFEREKYKKLNENKFNVIGRKIYQTDNKFGALYQVDNQ